MKRFIPFLLVIALFLLQPVSPPQVVWSDRQIIQEVRMSKSQPSKEEQRVLAGEALALARSVLPEDHSLLFQKLTSEEFLKKLDSEKAYQGPPNRLRLRHLLDTLSKNPTPSARSTLVALTQAPNFYKEPARADLLIIACAEVKPAPPEVIRFWDNHSKPNDGFTPLTIEAIVKNGSEPAIALLEKKMFDPKHEEEDKLDWMRSSILTHRNDLILLKGCERMVAGSLPDNLRIALIEVLFDYRPKEWYSPSVVFKAPDRRQATPEALAQLRKIGEFALKQMNLKDDLKEVIEKTLYEIKETR